MPKESNNKQQKMNNDVLKYALGVQISFRVIFCDRHHEFT